MDLSDRSTRMRVNKRFREKGIPAKVCGRCFVVKGHEAFHLRRRSADGRSTNCRMCASEVSRQWYETNREHHAETARRWYEANRERASEFSRRWHEANRDHKAKLRQQWREDNRELEAETSRRWWRANPDRVRVYTQTRKARNANVPTEPFTARDLRHDWEDHDLYSCFYCGGFLSDSYEIEHFYPKFPDDEETTPAGPHAVWNLVPSCVPCNRGVDGKHSREPWQFLRESLAEQGTNLDACLAVLDGRR